MDGTPLTFSFDAGLDNALTRGWEGWIEVARKKGVERTTEWLLRRDETGLDPEELEPLVEAVLESDSPFDRAMAASELAEYVEVEDDAMAAILWEGVLISGRDANDSEVYFEGLSQLAEIESEYGDPQAAAALFVDFLNWSRESGHSIEAEAIFSAFDRLIELAEADGAPAAAAEFGHAQTQFFRFVDGDDTRIVSENWNDSASPYVVWTD
ncbi:MAG TPA: hypothetical protein VFP05_02855 [Thermomicrobiales bacterium]|nr:hypothetical protein [Thermomicrobiales bacterium]